MFFAESIGIEPMDHLRDHSLANCSFTTQATFLFPGCLRNYDIPTPCATSKYSSFELQTPFKLRKRGESNPQYTISVLLVFKTSSSSIRTTSFFICCPGRVRTYSLLDQNQTSCQLLHRTLIILKIH